ncbi:MAG: CAP domain-containing protein [Rhodobacteraceae bacterium]|nr:CAP domain-containing protein [Paracoccaceae bacterium]
MRIRPPLSGAVVRVLATAAAAPLLAGCIVIIPLPLPGTTAPAPARPAAEVAAAVAAPPSCPAPLRRATEEAALVAGLNRLRAGAGLAPVTASARLAAVAQGQACDNAALGGSGHVGADGSGLAARLARGGYRHGVAAENTGAGYSAGADALAGWARSAGHRANLLLSPVREAGIGLARGRDGQPHWVLVLAEPR